MTEVFEVTVKMYVHIDDEQEKRLDERDEYITSKEYADAIIDSKLYEINYDAAMTGNPLRTSRIIDEKLVGKEEMESNLYTTEYDK